jgi:hypothetical protein
MNHSRNLGKGKSARLTIERNEVIVIASSAQYSVRCRQRADDRVKKEILIYFAAAVTTKRFYSYNGVHRDCGCSYVANRVTRLAQLLNGLSKGSVDQIEQALDRYQKIGA